MSAKGSLGIFVGWPIATPLRLRENAEGGTPPPPDPDWVADFQSTHGRDPNQQDWQDHLLSLRYPGTGPNGEWLDRDWQVYYRLVDLLRYPGTGPNGEWLDRDWQVYYRLVDLLGDDLLGQIGKRGGHGTGLYSGIGVFLALWKLEPGPDGTRIAYVRNFPAGGIPPNTTGWTWGNTILILESERNNRPLLMHEYTHVLQYRLTGIRYVPNYLKGGLYNWDNNPYEMQGVEVQQIYEWHPWLPPIWEIVWAGGRSG